MSAEAEIWVALLRLDLVIPGARSLKDRRQAVKSLKERLQSRFGVSCAEVGNLESWQRATLALAALSNEKQNVAGLADEIERYARNDPRVLVSALRREVFRFED